MCILEEQKTNQNNSISRSATCPCRCGEKYKKCCLRGEEIDNNNEPQRIINEFKFDRGQKALIHPLCNEKAQGTEDV